jgi:hypothetical protein
LCSDSLSRTISIRHLLNLDRGTRDGSDGNHEEPTEGDAWQKVSRRGRKWQL